MAPGLRLGRHFGSSSRATRQAHHRQRAAGDRAPSSQYCCFIPPRPVRRLVPAEPRPSGSCHAPRPLAPPLGSPPPAQRGWGQGGHSGARPWGLGLGAAGPATDPCSSPSPGGPCPALKEPCQTSLGPEPSKARLGPRGSRLPNPAVLWRERGGEAPGKHAHRQPGVSPFCAGQDGATASPGLGPDPALSFPALGTSRLCGFFLAQWAAGFSEHNGQRRSLPPRVTT